MHTPFFKTLLVMTNFSILSFLAIFMMDHVKANYNIMSWSSVFHILCICWLIMRGLFWLFTITSEDNWTNVTFYTLYWMPHPFQFGAFMLLPLFFAQVVYPTIWRTYWTLIRPMYIMSLFGVVIFQTVWAVLAAFEDKIQSDTCEDALSNSPGSVFGNVTTITTSNATSLLPDDGRCFHTDYSSNAFRLIASALFIGLATIQGIYGYQIAFLNVPQYRRFFAAPQAVLNAVNTTLFISFLSRGVYQFGTVFGMYILPQIPLQGDEDVSPLVFFCFELWDYVPTTLLILTVTARTVGTPRNNVPKQFPSVLGHETQRLLSPAVLHYASYGLFASEAATAETEMAALRGSGQARDGEIQIDHSSLERCVSVSIF